MHKYYRESKEKDKRYSQVMAIDYFEKELGYQIAKSASSH